MRKMNKPKIIMHNTVSLDLSIKNFDCDIGLHYQVAGNYQADAHLIGSITAKTGLQMFSEKIPPENESDFIKPIYDKDDKRPLWVIIDTKGLLKGIIHMYRRFEYCKDVIVLISNKSPVEYVKYLKDRNYEYIISGGDNIDFSKVFDILYSKYGIKTLLTDTGGTLNSILLEKGFIDEISIIITPYIVGDSSINLLKSLKSKETINLELKKVEVLENNYVYLRYKVITKK